MDEKKSVPMKIAGVIRILSAPPLIALYIMTTLCAAVKKVIFPTAGSFLWCLVSLTAVPILAYPLQRVFPHFRDKGRSGQRKLAFLFTVIGYAMVFVYAVAARPSVPYIWIGWTYILTVVLLTLINALVRFHASGHAASSTSLFYCVFFLGWKALIPSIAAIAVIFWSSVRTKRHTPAQFLSGMAVFLVSFGLGYLIAYGLSW